jgi:hypothetical protein
VSVKVAVTVKIPVPKAHGDEQPVSSLIDPFKPTVQTISPFALNVTTPVAATGRPDSPKVTIGLLAIVNDWVPSTETVKLVGRGDEPPPPCGGDVSG